MLLYPICSTESCLLAVNLLKSKGIPLTDHPSPEVTHLLMDLPSFSDNGKLRNGMDVNRVLEMLPPDVLVIGGYLDRYLPTGYRSLDLLKIPDYVCANAAITADCAIRLVGEKIRRTFRDSSALILGWGRIGKCLAAMLADLGCPVTVAARKEADRAILRSLGYTAVDFPALPKFLDSYSLIFNTVPESLPDIKPSHHCVTLDLASKQGLNSPDVIWARGLPGILAPETTGRLIANTVFYCIKEESM